MKRGLHPPATDSGMFCKICDICVKRATCEITLPPFARRSLDIDGGGPITLKDQPVFWIAATSLTILVALLLVSAVVRRKGEQIAPSQSDLQVYRDQLKELERDIARGTLSQDEAERTKIEISRRILDADRVARDEVEPVNAPRAATIGLAIATTVFLVGGGFGFYWKFGAPGYPDMPLQARFAAAQEARDNRPDQATAEASVTQQPVERDPQYVALVEQLRDAVERRPDDLRGYVLLAGNEAQLGNFAAAHLAQNKVIQIKGEDADARDYANYADLLILAGGGYVSPEAEAALSRALKIDPQNGTARYYSGLLFAQTGRPDVAFRIWQQLLETSTAEDPWVPAIRAQIEEAAYIAGVEYTLPDDGSGPGPTAADIAAAEDMSPEERQELILSMVDRLSTRLGRQGGTPDEWARLIGALSVLGETERAQAIWKEAQRIFADDSAALAQIGAAAESAGAAE